MGACAAVVVVVAAVVATRTAIGAARPEVVSPPHPPAVTETASPSSDGAGRTLRRGDLVYAAAARKDPGHWSSGDGLWNPGCTTGGGPRGYKLLGLTFTAGTGGEATAAKGEQILVFGSARDAKAAVNGLGRYLATCEPRRVWLMTFGAPAWSVEIRPAPGQVQRAVVFRQGAAIGIYWDFHNDHKPLATMAEHVRYAQQMRQRLCDLGWGC